MVIMSFGEKAKQYAKEQAIDREAQKVLEERDTEVMLDIIADKDHLRTQLAELLAMDLSQAIRDMSFIQIFRLIRKAHRFNRQFSSSLREYVDDGTI